MPVMKQKQKNPAFETHLGYIIRPYIKIQEQKSRLHNTVRGYLA